MKISKEWIKVQDQEYKRSHPPDFVTHSNYVNLLRILSENLSVNYNLKIKKKIPESKILTKILTRKTRLLNLTMQSIKAEYDAILKNPDYAAVCISWISVKSYYLFFNLLLILRYLITCDGRSFSYSHGGILKSLKDCIKKKELSFNVSDFNNIYTGRSILKWKAKPHANIKIIDPDLRERFFQIIKILMRYSVEEFKRKEKIKSLNSKKGKEFLDQSTINICEFFYWYRIKANYRDLEFLDKDIEDSYFRDYYRDYYLLTISFYEAFKDLINKLSMIRLEKIVLKN